MASARFTALLSLSALAYAKIGPSGEMVVASSLVNPDGFLLPRTAIQTNGKIDGDLVVANKGDTLSINLINNLNDNSMLQSTSIHWHGFFQRNGFNYADGPAFVNQCPIAKGHSFLYEFPTGDQAGTFWYHSHLSTQYCDGLRGPLVVYDPDDPHKSLYDVDDENTVITLADWYHLKAKLLIIGISDTTLINGKGRYVGGGQLAPLSVINVEQGKRYRMRFVSLSCDPTFTVAIDRHTDLKVIELDSISTVPLTVDSFDIFPGQRYSVILNANQAIGNYYIRANPTPGANQGFVGGINTAILRYQGAPNSEPLLSLPDTAANKLNEKNLVPLESPGAPGTPTPGVADKKFNLVITFGADGLEVNGVAYRSPSVPVLLQILSGARSPTDLLPVGSIYYVNRNDVVEVSIPGGAFAGPHPIHLHGHAFDLVRAAGQSDYNFANPPRRDVASAGNTGDNMTFRFKADNPGPWIMHCHIDWHLELGLSIVFAEAPDQWTSTIDPPASWDELCPIYNNLAPGDL